MSDRVDAGSVREAAQQLEAYFLRRMLAEVRGSSDEGGFAGSTFKEMFDEAIAGEMAKAGGVGIAETFIAELSGGAAPPVLRTSSAVRAYQTPVAGVETSGFGVRHDPFHGHTREHHGVDIAAAKGSPVQAASAGVVTRAESSGDYGNLVVVDHGNGLETRYAHLDAIAVQPGTRVERGTELGTVGSTGRATGDHLHFEVRREGKPIDPRNLGIKISR